MATSGPAGAFEVSVHIDMHEAEARGEEFFRAFEKALGTLFREVMMAALKVAQSLAPKGDHNYAIEDLEEVRRAGGSTSSRPANPGGFAMQQPTKLRIRKVPGGTLRRALTVAILESGETLTAKLGVPDTSPASKYAHIAEVGGVVQAKNVRYLRFSPDGQIVIFKPVTHRAAHPYALPALMYVWPLVQKVPERAFEMAKVEIG